jgi:probable F420-dependent oxidoreductase
VSWREQVAPLGRVGLWAGQLDYLTAEEGCRSAATAEQLGYRTLWVREGLGREIMSFSALLLGRTQELVVATGIASIWARDAPGAASAQQTLSEAFPRRFVLGLGVSHSAPVAARGHTYRAPLETMAAYLDAMDGAPYRSVPAGGTVRVLAALGPRMTALGAERADGVHPYAVTVQHTAGTRTILGDGPLLATEQAVALVGDASEGRRLARAHLGFYLTLPNYRRSFGRMGFSEDDMSAGGSDRLVDAIVAWGKPARVAARVAEHLDAGADHVCIQVLGAEGVDRLVAAWSEMAGAVSL